MGFYRSEDWPQDLSVLHLLSWLGLNLQTSCLSLPECWHYEGALPRPAKQEWLYPPSQSTKRQIHKYKPDCGNAMQGPPRQASRPGGSTNHHLGLLHAAVTQCYRVGHFKQNFTRGSGGKRLDRWGKGGSLAPWTHHPSSQHPARFCHSTSHDPVTAGLSWPREASCKLRRDRWGATSGPF